MTSRRATCGLAALWGLSTAVASGVGVLSEMSALQERPAIQVAPVVFVTQTVIPIVVAPLLFGESFADTPLGGVPLSASLALLVGGAALLARSPLLRRADGGRARQPAERLGAEPFAAEPGDDAREPETDADEPSSSTTSTSPARIER